MNDPIIEEVRRIRDEHSRRFDYSLDAICEDYKKRQASIGKRLVRLSPRALVRNQPTGNSEHATLSHELPQS